MLNQDLFVLRSVLAALRLRVGCVLLLVGFAHVAAGARVVPVYYSDSQGMEEASRVLLNRTVQVLNERIPDAEFRITRFDAVQRNASGRSVAPGLFFGDASQSLLLETEHSLRPVATVERHYEGQQVFRGGGVVIARAGSGFSSVADVQGQVVAAVEGGPLLSWVAAIRVARDLDIDLLTDPSDLLMRSSDQAVVRSVLGGEADIGIIATSVLEGMVAAGEVSMDSVVTLSPNSDVANFPFALSTALYPEYRLMGFEELSNDLLRTVGAILLLVEAAEWFPDQALQLAWTLPISCAEVQVVLQELRLPPFQYFGERDLVDAFRQHFFLVLGVGVLLVVMGTILSYVWALNRSLQSEINDRTEAEKQMKQSVERFEDIVSCSGDWIWEMNAQEQFTYCSDAVEKLLGWKPAALMGESMNDVLSSAERADLADERLMQPDRDLRRTLRMLTADGRIAVHECVAVPIRGSTGRVLGYRGVNRDVTQKQRVVSFDDE